MCVYFFTALGRTYDLRIQQFWTGREAGIWRSSDKTSDRYLELFQVASNIAPCKVAAR